MKTFLSFLPALLFLFTAPLASAQEAPPLSILTETGWRLAILADGSANLYRADNARVVAQAEPKTFEYEKLVTEIKDLAFDPAKHATEQAFYFGNERAQAGPLPAIPLVQQTLEKAQKLMVKTPGVAEQFQQYPLAR